MQSKKSICFVHKDIGEMGGGGISVSYGYLIDGFVKEGWDVYVITQSKSRKKGIYTITLPQEKDCQRHSVNARRAIEKIRNKISIIEGTNYKYELLEYLRHRRKGGPLVVIRSNPSCITLLFGNEYLKGEKEQSLRADYNLAVSEFSKCDVEKHYGVKVDKVIYEGINIEYFLSQGKKINILDSGYIFKNGQERQLKGTPVAEIISSDKINIFWCGKPTFMKGYDYLAYLIDNSKDDFNFILNTTPITASLGWNIDPSKRYRFVWGLGRDDQVKIWRISDMTLITSRVEGFSYVNTESLVLGLPVLANEECVVLNELFFNKYVKFFSPTNYQGFNEMVYRLKGQNVKLDSNELNFLDSARLVEETKKFYESIAK